MSYRIHEIQGIGPSFAKKLAAAKIENTDSLLDACRNCGGRKKVADATGVSESLLLKWSNMADMMRISGIGPQFAELLEASGVDTVKELSRRQATSLLTKMTEVNAKKKLASTVPASSVVQGWINTAKTTGTSITN